MNAAGDVAERQQDLFLFIFWIAVAVFVIVQALLLVAVVRFRQRRGHERDVPPQVHGSTPLEIAWTIAPALIVIAITIPTIQNIAPTYDPPAALASERSMTVNVIGHQWWWEFEYVNDATGAVEFVTANELHIPVDTVVNINLTSDDVIHSFWVPRLAGTRDVVPGRINRMWFRASETGVFPGACKELCGLSHGLMRFLVIVDPQAEFDAWAQAQRAPATITTANQAGWDLFQSKGCIGCHTIDGTDAAGKAGPNLTHFGSRLTIAANALHKGSPDLSMGEFLESPYAAQDPANANLKAWLRNAPSVKPGSLMPNLGLTDQEATTLAAFLESLE